MKPEDIIRDHLAAPLDLIEAGLVLIKTEFPLKNPVGSRGKVDILARDAFGHTVVIEIKRSDNTAREAVHELFKYVGLLQIELGLPPERLRCIVVSTEWRELVVPFSKFVRAAPFPVDGYRAALDKGGRPSQLQQVHPRCLH